ncbi:MAG TPA: carbamate kinase [Longimicrobiales bacterium]|nr:carbamate kinase [Longimicrobiales bacterium]
MISPLESGGTRTIVVALGGNALQPPGGHGDIHEQFAHTRESLGAVVALAQAGWRIVVVHGNGPQIGDELLRNELARSRRPPLPLGVLVASTAGWIGYMIQQSLRNALDRAGVRRPVVSVITQVLVDAADLTPRKPIGHTMPREQAEELATTLGWDIGPADGGWRRIVASPRPHTVVESDQIERLLEGGTIVIACGGGGTPVYQDDRLGLEGVDAVVDKDRAACILARDVRAEVLLILTNVDGAYRGYGTPAQQLLAQVPAGEAAALLEAGEFGTGSMGPKVEAAIDFVRGGGRRAIIARLERGLEAVEGRTGTTIVPE